MGTGSDVLQLIFFNRSSCMYRLRCLNTTDDYDLTLRDSVVFTENSYTFIISCNPSTSHITIRIGCIASLDITTPPTLPAITIPDNCTYRINLAALFRGYTNLKTIGNALDSLIPHDSHIDVIESMFEDCALLYEANIMNRLRLPKLKNAFCAFYGCRSLTGMYDFLVDVRRRRKTVDITGIIYGSSYDSDDYRWRH